MIMNFDNQSKRMPELNKTFNTIITIFLEILSNEMKIYVDKLIYKVQKAIQDIRKTIVYFESDIQRKIDEFTYFPRANNSKKIIICNQWCLTNVDNKW